MALLNQTKNCKVCEETFSPKKGVSYRQWEKSFWCSRKCYAFSTKGRKLSEAHKVAIALGNVGRVVTQETKDRIAIKNTGKIRTEAMKKRNSDSHLGIPSPLNGRKMPERGGANHWAWIEDRSLVKVGERSLHDPLQKQWRKQVKDRDNWSCRITDINCGGRLEAHHILSWRDFPELRYVINNGITLCHAHHPRKRAEEKRLIPTFQELVSVSIVPKSH